MIGWRARLGFLVPPGNPTVETEMIAMAPPGVSLHFHRMVARGTPGSLVGQSERNRSMLDNIDKPGQGLMWVVGPGVYDAKEPAVRLTFDVIGGDHMLRTVQFGGVITPNLEGRPKHKVESTTIIGE